MDGDTIQGGVLLVERLEDDDGKLVENAPRGAVRVVEHQGRELWQWRCPSCDQWHDLTLKQARGKESLAHDGCDFDLTFDLEQAAGLS